MTPPAARSKTTRKSEDLPVNDPQQMSRADMEAVIKGGGSVWHNGRFYNTVESLPSPGELAGVEGLKDEESELEARLKATRERRIAAEKAADAKKADEKADDEDIEKAPAKKPHAK
jgi:hypothetical protein